MREQKVRGKNSAQEFMLLFKMRDRLGEGDRKRETPTDGEGGRAGERER